MVHDWLLDIEDKMHSEAYNDDIGKWSQIRSRNLDQFEKSLRRLFVEYTRNSPDKLKEYIKRIIKNERLRSSVFEEIIEFSPLLVGDHSDLLVALTEAELKRELPDELENRLKREDAEHNLYIASIQTKPESERTEMEEWSLESPRIPHQFSFHDWHRLSIQDVRSFYPLSPLRDPFHSLFESAPDQGRYLVRSLANHAISAWRQLHKYRHDFGKTPIPVRIEFPWGFQEFWGDWPVYGWFRGWGHPSSVICGFMALEEWAFREIETGRAVDALIRDVIEENESVAALGVAIAIVLETQHVSETTLSLLSCQRLWDLDSHRLSEDHLGIQANLIGFYDIGGGVKAGESDHLEAVKKSNARKCRKITLQQMVTLYRFNHNEEIRNRTRELILKFPDDLPFDYEEERHDEMKRADLLNYAKIRAAMVDQSNFRAIPDPEKENTIVIEFINPELEKPEAVEKQSFLSNRLKEYQILEWASESFKNGKIEDSLTLEDAMKIAREIEEPEIYTDQEGEGADHLLSAITGVAAVILRFTEKNNTEAMSWAREIIEKAYTAPAFRRRYITAKSKLLSHPLKFVAPALAAEIMHNSEDPEDRIKLLMLVLHPLEDIAIDALKASFDCWEMDSRFSWIALKTILQRCIIKRTQNTSPFDPPEDDEEGKDREKAFELAVHSYLYDNDYPDLPIPPPSWEEIIQKQSFFRIKKSKNQNPEWRRTDFYWEPDSAAKIIKQIPLDRIMRDPKRKEQLLRFVDGLFGWTLSQLSPPIEGKNRGYQRGQPQLIEWNDLLSRLLVDLTTYLDLQEIQGRYLHVFFKQDDSICLLFLSPFVSLYTVIKIIDAKEIDEKVLPVLEFCLNRFLDFEAVRNPHARTYRLNENDVNELVRDFLFVKITGANGSVRFANGNWDDLPLFMPIIDRLVRSTFDSNILVSTLLTLCERSGSEYPVQSFVDQVLLFVNTDDSVFWQDTMIPLRIAGRIQQYADWNHPLNTALAQKMLRILDRLVDLGDRRSAALQISEAFRDIRTG